MVEWLGDFILWVLSIKEFIFLMIALAAIKMMFKERDRRPVETVKTVIPTADGRKRVNVELDKYKVEAVDALVSGWGMSRKSATAALESNAWQGYPDWEAMVQNVLSHGGPI